MGKSDILLENVIFIVLNLAFLAILILFLFAKTSSAFVLEEKYSKQIALMIDSAEPGMTIALRMEDAFDKAEAEEYGEEIVSINGNIVTVKLRNDGGYSYSFFNDVNAVCHLNKKDKEYGCVIEEKNIEEKENE